MPNNHLMPTHKEQSEPVPCTRCEAYRAEIAELKEQLALAELIIESEPKGGERSWLPAFADGLAKYLAERTEKQSDPPQNEPPTVF